MLAFARRVRTTLVASAVLGLALSVGPTPIRAADVQLVAAVRTAIAAAPGNFASIRVAPYESHDTYTSYTYTIAFSRLCTGCDIDDFYATATEPERFSVSMQVSYPETATAESIANDVVAQLGPVLKGYKLTRTGSGPVYLDWEGPNRTWVVVKTSAIYHDYDEPGFFLRVGHDVAP